MDDNFFCFDCDNLESVETRLYGYGICKNGIILDGGDVNESLTPLGAYVFVDANEDKINISQDYIGSYGLYYYSDGDYFAISNSFLKLMEHLRDRRKAITFNKAYADYYLASMLSANLSSKTLVNEIEMLSKDLEISIDKKTKKVEFRKLDLNEASIPIDSKEALDILDGWFFRWVEIVRSIRKSSNDIVIDLSGGFDSRLTSVIWLNANMDLSKIRINSGAGQGYEEDFSIASRIAEDFGFKLNRKLFYELEEITPEESMQDSEYVKFGFEKQRFIRKFRHANPLYRISGHCGEILREYVNKNPEDYVAFIANRARILDPSLKSSCETLLNQEFDELLEEYGHVERNSKELSEILYKHGRCRNHFGKEFVDSFLFNKLTITPLSDPDLQKIKFKVGIDDDKLLLALIFKRYCPKLLDFEFCGNATISPETLKVCDEINSIKEFEPRQYEFIEGPEEDDSRQNQNLPYAKGVDGIDDVFNSLEFKKEFEKYYPEELYNTIRLDLITNRNSSRDIYSAIEVVKTINDVKMANSKPNEDFNTWLGSFNKMEVEENEVEASHLANIYTTSRIDIKNFGSSDNGIEIIENSDESSKVSYPKWMSKDDGRGCIVSSRKMKLDLKIRIVNDGELSVKLRGLHVLDRNKNRFPVYIDYRNLTVGGEEIFNESRLLSHDDIFNFKMPVKDSQTVDVHVEWMPFSKSCEYENRKVSMLERRLEKEQSKKGANDSKLSRLISKL